MFKHNGTGTHFWIKEGVLTPLLTWRTADHRFLELSGKTFARKATGDQWFKQLVLDCDGHVLLSLTAQSATSEGGPMLVKQGRAGESMVNITVSNGKVEVEANGVEFSVKSASAVKFVRDVARDKYHHLNLEFSRGIPAGVGATGLFAQLAGLEPTLAATKEMLKRPASEQRRRLRHPMHR